MSLLLTASISTDSLNGMELQQLWERSQACSGDQVLALRVKREGDERLGEGTRVLELGEVPENVQGHGDKDVGIRG